jgi:signal transduction histidine kinase
MTLGSRLAATYAAVILVALLLFAAAAVFAIDRTLRATMDSRLDTEARAAASLADISHGKIVVDDEDRRQFLTLIAEGDDGLVLDDAGRLRLSSTTNAPASVLALPRTTQRSYYTTGKGEAVMRALVFPVMQKDAVVGTVIVWRASDWIADSDRGAAIAFAAAAIIIAILALIAGSAVTRRALEDAFARQRRFTADASHELRAPLSVIRAEADLALRKERSPREYRSAMETIANEADLLELLIGDLLAAARAESGTSVRERVELLPLIQAIANRLQSAAKAKDATIAVGGADRAVIMADRQGTERALLAIAHNAVAHVPAHGLVRLEVQRHGNNVDIAVRDNGPGFTQAALEHALERFWRDDAGRSHGGTGLGLAIANSIVHSSGGSITLENDPAGGAIVRLRFPAAQR